MLRCVISAYVRTGEPVASATALQHSGLSLCPATVRVVFAELAEAGLLEQPHASAGRRPTQAGFRHFVDHLLRTRAPSPVARGQVAAALSDAGDAPGQIIRAASRHLASTFALTALGRSPRLDASELRRLELVRIDPDRVLAVAVFAGGGVRNHLVQLPRPYDASELERARNLFNDNYAGMTLAEARLRLRAALEAVEARGDARESDALRLAESVLPSDESPDEAVIVEGRTHFLEHSGDTEQASAFLRALEDKQLLLELLDRLMSSEGTRVVFGGETDISGLHECTVVAASYEARGLRLGTLAIVGPLRMNYGRVVPLVGYTARAISGLLHASSTAA